MSSDGVNGNHIADVDFVDKNAVVSGQPIRMRVISDILFNNAITGCDDLRFGQTEDYSVVMVNGDGSISGISSNTLGVSIFPNPATNVLNINYPKSQDLDYMITDIAGKLIDSNKLGNAIDISGLESGSYFITLQSKTTSETMKFTKL